MAFRQYTTEEVGTNRFKWRGREYIIERFCQKIEKRRNWRIIEETESKKQQNQDKKYVIQTQNH